MKEISINGCKFAYEVIGGSPAVLLETGVGAMSSDWGLVAAGIAKSKRKLSLRSDTAIASQPAAHDPPAGFSTARVP